MTRPINLSSDLPPLRVSILGCTGSIGSNTLRVLDDAKTPYKIVSLTVNKNVNALIALAKEHQPECVAIAEPAHYDTLKAALAGLPIDVMAGKDGVIEAASREADWTMASIIGEAGLLPTYAALKHSKVVALANKESLVCAGHAIMDAVKQYGTTLIPVDSEHSAIFQVFDAPQREGIDKIILTASGGPFRTWDKHSIAGATPEQALKHPNWDMGAKITIDSASMMNKGLEVIEAYHLFQMPADKIEVILHPESIIHSMVEYVDGSVLAQLGTPDMRTPIAVSLAWPKRMPTSHERLDLRKVKTLTFEDVSYEKFPCLELAYIALRRGGVAPAILNAANEVAVDAFVSHEISFYHIPELIHGALEYFSSHNSADALNDTLALCQEVREYTAKVLQKLPSKKHLAI